MNHEDRCPTCGRKTTFGVIGKPKDRQHRPGMIDILKGNFSTVSPEDEEYLLRKNWYTSKDGYAIRHERKWDGLAGRKVYKRFYMHRVVMERVLGRPLERHELVDHIDRNRLNNKRANLRLANVELNSLNKSPQKNSPFGLKGVTLAPSGRYAAAIRIKGQNLRLNTYLTPEEAAWMYDQWAIAFYGEYAGTNFTYL